MMRRYGAQILADCVFFNEGYGKAEEVCVEVVGTRGGSRVRSFSMTFLSRFQLISSMFPDDILLQAPVAVARCLPLNTENMQAVDEELAEFCQRNMPIDLSFRHFFGSVLLHVIFIWCNV